MKTQLGRLERVDLRTVWSSEAGSFTPWLAKPENLEALGDSVGLALVCEAQEKRVGPFRADILCRDSESGAWVLIENQLERTDHTHLGQLLTYAAGLDAVNVVWVAERFTEEHRAALDWLNERTDEKIHFFGLEVELWRIGDSAPAPKFNVVCKPNEWTRVVAESAKAIDAAGLSDHQQLQYEYWTEFLAVLRARKQVIESRTPQASHWMGFPAGRSGFRLFAEMYARDHAIGVGITFQPPHAHHFIGLLRPHTAEMEKEIGGELVWDTDETRGQNYVGTYFDCDPTERADWPRQHQWLAEKLQSFQQKIGDRLKTLPAP